MQCFCNIYISIQFNEFSFILHDEAFILYPFILLMMIYFLLIFKLFSISKNLNMLKESIIIVSYIKKCWLVQIKKSNIFIIFLMHKNPKIGYNGPYVYFNDAEMIYDVSSPSVTIFLLYLSTLRVEQMLHVRDNHFFVKNFFLKWIICNENQRKTLQKERNTIGN